MRATIIANMREGPDVKIVKGGQSSLIAVKNLLLRLLSILGLAPGRRGQSGVQEGLREDKPATEVRRHLLHPQWACCWTRKVVYVADAEGSRLSCRYRRAGTLRKGPFPALLYWPGGVRVARFSAL
jgi:hypothetical protein